MKGHVVPDSLYLKGQEGANPQGQRQRGVTGVGARERLL